MIIVSIQVILSIGLAIIFFASAVPKLLSPRSFILAVLEYRVLPTRLSWMYARLLPPLELLLALLLISGTAIRSSAIVVALLLLSFIIAVSINLARGRDLDCHCFGKTRRRSIGWGLLLQDGVLLGAAIVLAVITSTWLAPVSWSLFRLSGLAQEGSPMLLLGCAVVTVCAATLLGRSTIGKGRFRSGGVKK